MCRRAADLRPAALRSVHRRKLDRAVLRAGLRHEAGFGPALQARPHPPVEAEAIDREDAAAGREGHHPRSDEGEAALLEHPPRGRIHDPRRRGELPRLRIGEEGVDQRPGGFRGVALAPMGAADPVAEMGNAVLGARLDSDRPDRAVALAGDREREAGPFRVVAPGAQHEGFDIADRQRMRDPRRHLGYGFLTGEADGGLGIGAARPAQPETAGLKPKNVVAGEVGKHGLLRSERPSFGGRMRRRGGDVPPPLPDLSLAVSRPSELSSAGSVGHRRELLRLCSRRYSAACWAGMTDTKARPDFVRNRTRPSAVANRVWSLPMPTFAPAWNLVPR